MKMETKKPLYCIVDASDPAFCALSRIELYMHRNPWALSADLEVVPIDELLDYDCPSCAAFDAKLLLFHSVEAAENVIETISLRAGEKERYHVVDLAELFNYYRLHQRFEEVPSDG